MAEVGKAKATKKANRAARPSQSIDAAGRAVANIIWIASYPKSGNTWIRVFLHNLLRELTGQADAPQDINHLGEHSLRENRAVRFDQVLGKPAAEANQAEIARARPEVQRRLATAQARPVFVKTHLCFGNDYRYPTINLDATLAAIYVVRNPMDIAISYAHFSGQQIDAAIMHMATPGYKILGAENQVYEVLGSWSQHVASWMGMSGRPVHLMRYEDMLANPERSFGALARFLRLAPGEEQVKRALANSSFAELRRQEEEHGFKERPDVTERFFREGRPGQWSRSLTQQQIKIICGYHAPIMQRFGYLLPDCGRSLSLVRQGRSDIAGRAQTLRGISQND